MKKRMIGFVAGTLTLIATACSKDRDHAPPFTAKGYWKGAVYLYNSAIVNRENGTARFYFYMTGFDSSTAGAKYDGTYSVANGIYKLFAHTAEGDTLLFESTGADARLMKGIAIMEIAGTTAAVPSEFIKQP